MGSTEAIELIHWFNEKAFDISREYLLENYELLKAEHEAEKTPLPDGTDQYLQLTNSNLLFFRGLARVNQHMPYHFSMLLKPADYGVEWKLLLC